MLRNRLRDFIVVQTRPAPSLLFDCHLLKLPRQIIKSITHSRFV